MNSYLGSTKAVVRWMDMTHGLRYSMHDRVCILARLSTFIGAKWTPGGKGIGKRQAEPNAVEALVFKWLHNHTPRHKK